MSNFRDGDLVMAPDVSGYAFVGKTMRYSFKLSQTEYEGLPVAVCYEGCTLDGSAVYHIIPEVWLTRVERTCECCGQTIKETN